MWRHIAANALTVFLVALFLLAGLVLWGRGQWSGPGPLAEAMCLRVPEGGSMAAVADDLGQKGAVSSPAVFRVATDYAGLNPDLKAGSYLIAPGASMRDIAREITRGGASTCGTEVVYVVGVSRTLAQVRAVDPATGDYEEVARFDPTADPGPDAYADARADPATTYRVVVAEGTTSWQVVQALNALDALTGDVDAVPPEGTLAPDSYAVAPGDGVAELIARMEEAQGAILAAAWDGRAADLPFDTPEEALTLASIIEKETAVPAERPVVSSVLVNRLRRGDMRLQFDPTIIYGITRGQGVLDRPIRQSDIAGDTERELHGEVLYNTYVIDGLPAGPIANPGRAAIQAAVDPAETSYLYFVADGTGGHAFAATLAEHEANVARFRAIEAERAAAEAAGATEDATATP